MTSLKNLGSTSGVPSTAGSGLSKINGFGKAMTRPRRIPKSPASTKARANPKETVNRKECFGSAARTTIIKRTARKAGNVAKAKRKAHCMEFLEAERMAGTNTQPVEIISAEALAEQMKRKARQRAEG